MKIDLGAQMRRATERVQTADIAGATQIIREALGAAGLDTPAGRPAEGRGLGEVVRRLREGRGPMPGFPPTDPVLPEGAVFEARTFDCGSGSRALRLYVPASEVRGLVVMLHGCTQTPEDFAVGTGMNAMAERHGLLVAYPGQTAVHNANGCWNWFRPGDQARDRGEPAILGEMARALAAEFAVPEGGVFIAGLSAGGAMAAVVGDAYPEIFAAVGVHSGLAPGLASDVPSAFAAMRGAPAQATGARRRSPEQRLIVFQGGADPTVHRGNAERLLAWAAPGPVEDAPPYRQSGRRPVNRTVGFGPDGRPTVELWMIEGAGHAWAGGDPAGSYTDPNGPDASAEMVRFFLGL